MRRLGLVVLLAAVAAALLTLILGDLTLGGLGWGPQSDRGGVEDDAGPQGAEGRQSPRLLRRSGEAAGGEAAGGVATSLALGPHRILVRVLNAQRQLLPDIVVALQRRPAGPIAARLDPTGQLAARSHQLAPGTWGDVRLSRSSKEGLVRFEGLLNDGQFRVQARPALPYFSNVRPVDGEHSNAAAPAVIDLIVGEGSPLRIRVVDADANPLGCFVTVRGAVGPEGSLSSWSSVEQATDGAGEVLLAAVPSGALRVSVRRERHGQLSGLPVTTPRTEPFVIVFDGGEAATVRGRVMNEDGSGVAGATLRLETGLSRGSLQRSSRLETLTDAEGHYHFERVAAARIKAFTAAAPGHLMRMGVGGDSVPLLAGEERVVDLVLPRGGAVEGIVVDPGGAPLAGALIRYSPAFGDGSLRMRWVVPTATSDEEGRFRVEHVPAGEGTAWPSLEGWRRVGSQPERTCRVAAPGQTATLRLVLERGVDLSGEVLDVDGAPVSGALVEAGGLRREDDWFSFRRHWQPVRTDANGRFELPGLEPGKEIFLRASSATGWSQDVAIRPTRSGTPGGLTLILRAGASIRGRVLEASGEASAGRELALTVLFAKSRGAGLRRRFERRARCDETGAFQFEGLPAGPMQIQLKPLGWRPRFPSEEPLPTWLGGVTWGERLEGVELRAPPAGSIAGVVVDLEGEPARGVLIGLKRDAQAGGGIIRTGTGQGGDGSFRFPNLPVEAYEVIVAGVSQGTYEAGETGLRFVVARRPADLKTRYVEGRVLLPSGAPLPAAGIVLEEAATGRRLASGKVMGGRCHLRWTGEQVTSVRVLVKKPRDALGVALNILERPVPVKLSEDLRFTVRLPLGKQVTGRVRDAEGRALGRISILLELHAQGVTQASHAAERTDSAGRFAFVGLPAGTCRLRIRAAAFLPVERTVPCGTEGIEVTLQRGSMIAGRVVGPDGSPASRARVSFRAPAQDGREQVFRATRADDEGHFLLEGLPAGLVGTLSARADPGAAATSVPAWSENVSTGSKGHVLTLGTPQYIEGRVQLPSGREAEDLEVYVTGVEGARPAYYAGRFIGLNFRIGPMPAGTYKLRVQAGRAFPEPAPVVVQVPATGVVVPILAGVAVSGRVLVDDASGFVVCWLWREASGELTRRSTRSAKDGSFRLMRPDDSKGTLYVRDRRTGEMALRSGVRPSEGPFLLRLTPGLSLAGRLLGAPLGPSVSVQARGPVWATSRTDEDGNFVFRGLPPGRYELSALVNGVGRAQQSANAGQTGILLRVERR